MNEEGLLTLKMSWQFAFDGFVAEFQAALAEFGLETAILAYQETVKEHERQFKMQPDNQPTDMIAKAIWRSAYQFMWACIVMGVWDE